MILHQLKLKVELVDLFMVLLKHFVQHFREHILVNKFPLLFGWLLVAERLIFSFAFVFGCLNEAPHERLLLLKRAFMLGQEVIEKLYLDQVLFRDNHTLLGGLRLLVILPQLIDVFSFCLGPLL